MRRLTNPQPIAGALRLKGAQRFGVLVRKAAGDRREQLRDLHQRSLEAAERAPELGGIPLPVGRHAEVALPRHARGDAADPKCRPARSGARARSACRPPDPACLKPSTFPLSGSGSVAETRSGSAAPGDNTPARPNNPSEPAPAAGPPLTARRRCCRRGA